MGASPARPGKKPPGKRLTATPIKSEKPSPSQEQQPKQQKARKPIKQELDAAATPLPIKQEPDTAQQGEGAAVTTAGKKRAASSRASAGKVGVKAEQEEADLPGKSTKRARGKR